MGTTRIQTYARQKKQVSTFIQTQTQMKSLLGKRVRIKREYIKYTADRIPTVELRGTPFDLLFDTCEQDDNDPDINNPYIWDGVVDLHIFGLDDEPRDLVYIRSICNSDSHVTLWDAKYFEVIKKVEVTTYEWVVDEEFKQ